MKKISVVIICLAALAVGFYFWKKENISAPVITHTVAEGMKMYSDHGFTFDYPEDLEPEEKEMPQGLLVITFGDEATVDYISDSAGYDASLKTYGRYTGIEQANGYNFHIHEKKDAAGKDYVTYSLKAEKGGYIVYLGENSRMSLQTFFLK